MIKSSIFDSIVSAPILLFLYYLLDELNHESKESK